MTEFQDDPEIDYIRTAEGSNRKWHTTAVAMENDYHQALGRPGQDQSPAVLHSQYLRRRRIEQTVWQARLEDAAATYHERTGKSVLPHVGWTPEAPAELPAPGASPPRLPADTAHKSLPQSSKGLDRARWLPLIVVIGVLLVLAVIGTIISVSGKNRTAASTTTDTREYNSTVEVLYEVEGTATGADLTLEAPTGTVQGTDKAVPLANVTTGKRGISYTMTRGPSSISRRRTPAARARSPVGLQLTVPSSPQTPPVEAMQ